MWSYDKRLQFPVKIKNPDPQTAKIVITSLADRMASSVHPCAISTSVMRCLTRNAKPS